MQLEINSSSKILSRFISSTLVFIALSAGLVQSTHAKTPDAAACRLSLGEHIASLPEVKIWYRVAGHGPMLVAVSPQWGVGSSYLQKGISPLEKHFTVVYVDTRGSEHSSRPDDARHMSTSAMVDDLEQLRQYWGVPAINVLGHSGGGAIVLGYAERYPSHAEKIIMVDTEVTDLYPSPDTDKILEQWKHDPEHARWVDPANDPFHDDATFTRNLSDTLGLYLYRPSKTAKAFAATLPTSISYWVESNWEKDDKLLPMSQSEDLGKVKAKSLIIVGRHDFICPVSMGQRAHEGIQGSQLVIFEQSGHMPWIEEPGKFFALVTQFLHS